MRTPLCSLGKAASTLELLRLHRELERQATTDGLTGLYPEANRTSVAEMVRQVGPLRLDRAGIASRGVLVRHLVLPERGGETAAALRAVRSISPRLPVSLMFQYFPAHRAVGHPVLGRRLWREECAAARRALGRAGVTAGWRQGYD